MPSAAVEAAFQARLLEYTGDDPPFISSIVSAQPSSDQDMFLEVQYPVVNGIRRIINERHYCEEGAALLILNVRRNAELPDALAVADNLANIFRHVKFNSVETFAPDAPTINDNNNDGNWYSLSVIVPYRYQTTYPVPHAPLMIEAGSYVISGTSAGLEYGYSLTASGGVYVISGNDVILLVA